MMRLRLVGLMAVMTMVLASCGGGAPDAAGPSEGIQVHGDWTIDIYNEDGSLDHHLEFSNAFFGQDAVAAVMSQNGSVGAWSVELIAPIEGTQPCVDPTGTTQANCVISQGTGTDNSFQSFNLAVSNEDGVVVLTGSHFVSADGDIGAVDAFLEVCNVGVTVPCTGTSHLFSSTDVRDPDGAVFQVNPGQQVEIRVEYSFTSG